MALLSIRAYAKHRGVAESAVRKAIADGRITTTDGQINPSVADREWDQNTAHKPSKGIEGGGSGVSYQQSRAHKETYEALLKKLEYEEKSGKLVEIARVEMDAFNAARVSRDLLLLIPDRVAPILLGETDMHKFKDVMRKEIMASLQDLTGFLHGGSES